MLRSRLARAVSALIAAALVAGIAPAVPDLALGPVAISSSETTLAIHGSQDFALPPGTTHVAIHWPGHPDATVTAAFSADGRAFSEAETVELDEVGEARGDGESYGSVMGADGMRMVRIHALQPLSALSVLSLNTARSDAAVIGLGARTAGVTTIPGIISRSAWGADESLRFDGAGDELWEREYYPLQKLVVHHTAGRNSDPDPAATVRAIYYYHAVKQGWGDIGYQYLIDEAGRVYEGRHSRDYWRGAIPTSDNPAGLVVTGGQARLYNSGNMGIALLGTFTSQAPTAAARASLVKMLAWAAATHGINPTGSGTYVNPVTGLTRKTPNIAGHRDYNATGCPGGTLYSLLPAIRKEVASQINPWPGQAYNPARTITFAAGTYVGRRFSATGSIISSKSYTLTKASGAPTNQRSSVPNQTGNWYYVTAGVWAGYWIREAPGMTLSGDVPAPPPVEVFDTARPLSLAPGTYLGRKFNTYGVVTASKSYEAGSGAVAWTTQMSGIPRQGGSWYYITVGPLEGYWIPASAGTSLGDPPPPAPPPLATYDPPRKLVLAPGKYVGRRFSQYGVTAATKTYILAAASSAPVSMKSTIVNQSGAWYFVTAGVWEGYWIKESTGTTLAPP
ncbi:MAG: N-acetylmuramoyl-L-alanine amidase [Chloroflexota bacterium]|nr:N-acetylmuramoyl-L-alanine amidase [Chloroflexota bacterium]